MKNKIGKILGIGLSAGLIFGLIGALFAAPVSADLMEWGIVNTPSWEDDVIVPGSDIYDYAVGPDGDTIYAVGEITSAEVTGESIIGLSGSFTMFSGEVTITRISDDTAEIEATLVGDACYLNGDFTAILWDVEVATEIDDAVAHVTGKVTGNPDSGNDDDLMTFSGQLHPWTGPFTAFDTITIDTTAGDTICVNDQYIQNFGIGDLWVDNDGWYTEPRVWKSEDGGVTWDDITSTVQDAANLPGPFIQFMYGGVAVAPDDEEWLVVAGTTTNWANGWGAGSRWVCPGNPAVVASKDGGDNFSYTGDMNDATEDTYMDLILDVAVAPETDDIHNIAVAGINDQPAGTVYRLEAGTWLSAAWEDTSFYDGWDEFTVSPTKAVMACEFSPNFDIDDSIVVIGVDDVAIPGIPYLQSGIWESSGAWNAEAGFPDAVEITYDGETLNAAPGLRSMGLALPDDYDGSDPGARSVFCYVNASNDLVGGFLMRVDNGSVSEPFGPRGEPLLASIDFHGDADTGKMMVGEYMQWDNDYGDPVRFDCCEGVRVWHTVEMDPCCPDWELACKNPSGPYMALVAYTPDGDKAYAATSGALDLLWFDGPWQSSPWYLWDMEDYWGGLCDESAFSVSLDDGVSFNQLGIIDTDIDYLSDVAVCPDCGVIYLSTINLMECHYCCPDWDCFGTCMGGCMSVCGIGCFLEECDPYCQDLCGADSGECYDDCVADCMDDCMSECEAVCLDSCMYGCAEKEICQVCECDSVWRSYDNGDTWERVFHGDWADDAGEGDEDHLLLRLPCDELEECCTIYLGITDVNTDPGDGDGIFYSRDCGQCWNETPLPKIDIQDITVESENVIYVLDSDGYVSKSTQYGRRWSDAVDTEIGSGHTITSCCDQGFIVVGGAGDEPVAWSDDGGETWNLTEDLPGISSYTVHIACDPICEGTIYAALSGPIGTICTGIYRWVIGDSTDWDDLNAFKYGYYGIAVGRSDGTLYAVSDNIHVDPDADICDRFVAPEAYHNNENNLNGDHYYEVYSGVARNLTPCETDCCGTETWDYLICGLGTHECEFSYCPDEYFNNEPSGLRICGCITSETNTILYAIDTDPYDVTDGAGDNDEFGSLWSYEDCAAKAGPTLTAPADGAVLDCEPCAGCDAANFTLKWERMCEACSYDVEIMDEDGNLIISWDDVEITGDPPELFIDGTKENDSVTEYALECGNIYTWHVRESDTLCECVHSPWSETWSFTVAVGAADAIQLLAPEKGAMDVPIQNVGFSWTNVHNATSYSFVLSPNANLAGALVSQNMSTTAFNFVGPLDYSKAYYWQIIAWQDSTRLTTSSIGVFNTMAEPAAPTPPVVVEQQPAPVINIPPAERITPTWIYAIIGIGCALAVVVIVLIVRTRRP